MKKKNIFLLIGEIIYFCALGFLVPHLLTIFNLVIPIYIVFEDLAGGGFFFFLYLMGTIVFFPFIYSTLSKGRLSFNIKKTIKNGKASCYQGLILFMIGIPIMIWLTLANLGYYSIITFTGGLAILVYNGFLVLIILLMYFCIIPAFILFFMGNIQRFES
ncbi:MAG: hypothetical protein ACXABO_12665 [Promethearchaeota archaeon]